MRDRKTVAVLRRQRRRVEIASALRRSITVVPLLVDGARMPHADQLPDDMKPLARRNGTQIRHDPDFHADMTRLLSLTKMCSLQSYGFAHDIVENGSEETVTDASTVARATVRRSYRRYRLARYMPTRSGPSWHVFCGYGSASPPAQLLLFIDPNVIHVLPRRILAGGVT